MHLYAFFKDHFQCSCPMCVKAEDEHSLRDISADV